MTSIDNLTIAIPVFERKEYFRSALVSILEQSVKCKLLVVDNASSHNFFKDTCSELGVPYFRNQRNIGIFPNWNKCFELADSDYVMILGDDDQLDKKFVETFANCLNDYNQIDIFFSNFLTYRIEDGQLRNHTHKLPFGFMENGDKIIEYGIRYRLGFPVISSVIRKSVFTGFYQFEHGSNDWLWIYENIKPLKVYGYNMPLLKYGIHPNQDSKNYDTQMKGMLSISFIYGEVLSNQVEYGSELWIIAKKRSKSAFKYFLAFSSRDFTKVLTSKKHIYGKYYIEQMKANPSYRLFLLFPDKFRWFYYRVLRKLRIVGKV